MNSNVSDDKCPSCTHTECSCDCSVCEEASETDRPACECYSCSTLRVRAAQGPNRTSLIEIVKSASARFDQQPEYRASIEARAELKNRAHASDHTADEVVPARLQDDPDSAAARVQRLRGYMGQLVGSRGRALTEQEIAEDNARRKAEGKCDLKEGWVADTNTQELAEALVYAGVVNRVMPVNDELDRSVERALRSRTKSMSHRKLGRGAGFTAPSAPAEPEVAVFGHPPKGNIVPPATYDLQSIPWPSIHDYDNPRFIDVRGVKAEPDLGKEWPSVTLPYAEDDTKEMMEAMRWAPLPPATLLESLVYLGPLHLLAFIVSYTFAIIAICQRGLVFLPLLAFVLAAHVLVLWGVRGEPRTRTLYDSEIEAASSVTKGF